MITLKAKYALKALIVLADEKHEDGQSLRIEDIARRSGAPRRFLEHILLDLKRAGLIGSRRGRHGGYELIKDAGAISLAAVLRMADGPIAPLPCLSRTAYRRCEDCPDEKSCRIRAAFGGYYAAYLAMIEGLSLADLVVPEQTLEQFELPDKASVE